MLRVLKRFAVEGLGNCAPLAWRFLRTPRILVLTYHRVLPPGHPDRKTEQPGMYVSPETLDMHLRVLRQYFAIVQLDDWIKGAAAGASLPRLSCALTFDDGWRDNFEHAFPVLRRHGAPATVFLVSSFLGTTAQFWPDRLRSLLLNLAPDEPLPGKLGSLLAAVRARAGQNGRWTADDLDTAITAAKELDDATICEFLDAQAGPGAAPAPRRLLDADEVAEMASSGLIRFGSHTRTHHRCLAGSSDDTLRDEIVNSRAEIARYSGMPVDIFCYPNGAVTPRALAIVREHYLAAVVTRRGWHREGLDRYQISRIGVHEDVAGTPAALLSRLGRVA